MKKLALIIAILTLAAVANAGALFDDYLNYVRPGVATAPGKAQVAATVSQPAGQSIEVPASTAEVYRIGVRPVYDTWNPGEQVTMTLYDAPDTRRKLASYSIEEATCHVRPYVTGNGSQFAETGDRVLYFQFRKPTEGRTRFYLELTVQGGDGSVSFQAIDEPKGLSFECDVKPAADREANLKAFFTERLDLSRPELAAVKAAVQSGDWEKAIAETVKHFHSRRDIWQAWENVMQPKLNPSADTKTADMILKGFMKHSETGEPLPWRKESWWASEIPGTKDPAHTVEPSPYLWHIDRTLGAAYTDTAKPDYARKAIDLRMQFILDNPNPKFAAGKDPAGVFRDFKSRNNDGETPPFRWYFDLWNDRTAGARAPGHGDLVYARLYNYPGWTNDEKLVLFSFFEDNARWDYRSASGANWGAEAARACVDFGIRFPEWKLSPGYVRWGASHLAEIVMEDIRRDGTSSEGSIKYHAMVARRLKGLLEDYNAGNAPLDSKTHEELVKVLTGMYDVMASTLQPSSYVVMCGDSWYENFTGELGEVGRMVNRPDFTWIATQGKQGAPPKETSKVYPEGGYYIMRSDFGDKGRAYTDSRQLFIHNGNWFGSHGHPDILSVNLFGYGRAIVIDPGQYEYVPPPGIDKYWNSKIHSMLVCEGRDVDRAAGDSEWVTNPTIDWFDGASFGYHKLDNVDYTRRRVAFVRPDYFLIDDSAKTTRDTDWMQVWNLTDPSAKADQATGTIETTFPDGGNLLLMSQDPSGITVEEAKGITASKDTYPATKVFRLHRRTADPRFVTLLYPYNTGARPDVQWERINPDDSKASNLFYSLRIRSTPATRYASGGFSPRSRPGSEETAIDWAAFGESGKRLTYRGGAHVANADFALVRTDQSGTVKSFAWAHGRGLVFNRETFAVASADLLSLSVRYVGKKLIVEAREPDSALAIRTGGAQVFELNGKIAVRPMVKSGFYYPFADQPRAIVADDRTAFERVTKTNEWARVADPNSYSTGYTHHETDPGRHEEGNYVFAVPAAGSYRVELYLPTITMVPSDRVEYRIEATGIPAKAGGAIVDVREEGKGHVFVVNQQSMSGWVSLGDFVLQPGELKINAKNVTTIDGPYFTADAMRLVKPKP